MSPPRRNRVPWIINTVVFGGCALALLALRFYLALQNKMREREGHDDTYDDVYLTHIDEKGNTVEKKVDKVRFTFADFLSLPHVKMTDLSTGLP